MAQPTRSTERERRRVKLGCRTRITGNHSAWQQNLFLSECNANGQNEQTHTDPPNFAVPHRHGVVTSWNWLVKKRHFKDRKVPVLETQKVRRREKLINWK